LARRRSFVRGAAAIREKRETLWIDHTITSTLVAGGIAVLVASLSAASLALRPFTILRTRGIFHLHSDQQVATEIFTASMGLAVVSDQASAIGVTAIPTPVTDMSSDLWFMHETIASKFYFATAVGIGPEASQTRVIDSKAMRKVQDGEDIVVVVEAPALSFGTVAVTQFRQLIRRN